MSVKQRVLELHSPLPCSLSSSNREKKPTVVFISEKMAFTANGMKEQLCVSQFFSPSSLLWLLLLYVFVCIWLGLNLFKKLLLLKVILTGIVQEYNTHIPPVTFFFLVEVALLPESTSPSDITKARVQQFISCSQLMVELWFYHYNMGSIILML